MAQYYGAVQFQTFTGTDLTVLQSTVQTLLNTLAKTNSFEYLDIKISNSVVSSTVTFYIALTYALYTPIA